MKPLGIFGLVLLVAAAVGGAFLVGRLTAFQQGATAGAEKTFYTCGMHPQVIQDHPGNCPICGMKLTKVHQQAGAGAATGERKIKFYKSTMLPGEISQAPGKDSMGMERVPVYEGEAAADLGTIAIDPVTIQDMGIRTGIVTNGPLRRTIRTVGVVDLDESAVADVTTKFKGWAEKLHANATGQLVMRGDPLFEIYSPELYSAQTEYLLALSSTSPNDAGLDALKTSARLKLKFWDISDEQIAELEKTRRPTKTLRVHAPIDGFVMEKTVVEGQMVEAGMKLYRIADLGLVWVQAQIYEQDLPFIKLGQEAAVSLTYLPDRKFRGRVTYIYPTVDEKTRTVKVRMEFHNPGYFLKPGMFAAVALAAELSPATLLVPDLAVLRSGERNTVFVALAGGQFSPRRVTLGPRAEGDYYQVLGGLEAGERVVTSGQFMLDSESQLRAAIQQMLEPGATPAVTGTQAAPGHAIEPPAPTGGQEPVVYLCPMPEHVSIQYDHPGNCPICGMKLVPVTPSELRRVRPGGRVLYYTCPMPEHADVHRDKPGQCPRCGMTLIPVMADVPAPPPETSPVPAPAPMTLYTCPMASHADVVADKPGRCPKCGMDLVPTSTVKHGKIAEENWRKQHAAPSTQPPAPAAP
jgi:multidrug efflux pump subunit AcrA (membrane-fusion protein)